MTDLKKNQGIANLLATAGISFDAVQAEIKVFKASDWKLTSADITRIVNVMVLPNIEGGNFGETNQFGGEGAFAQWLFVKYYDLFDQPTLQALFNRFTQVLGTSKAIPLKAYVCIFFRRAISLEAFTRPCKSIHHQAFEHCRGRTQ